MTTDSTDTEGLRERLKTLAGEYGLLSELGGASLSFYFDELEVLISEHTAVVDRMAEGRGRTAVLSAVKDWADGVELSYQKMIEAELSKIKALNSKEQGEV